MGLCLNIDCNSGLEVDCEVILKDRNLRDQAFDQRLVKLCDGGGLLMDEILQVLDQAHLLILDHAVDLGLFSHIPEPEDFIRDGIVCSHELPMTRNRWICSWRQKCEQATARGHVTLSQRGVRVSSFVSSCHIETVCLVEKDSKGVS